MADGKDEIHDTGVATGPEAQDEAAYVTSHEKAQQKILHDARLATEKERSMTLMQGIRLYPKAIAWSVLISACIIMV